MRRLTSFAMTIGLCTIVIGGCARREPPLRPAPPIPPAEVRPMAARDYVATASSIDLFVIEASRVAQSRARSARIRDFAAMLVRDHQGTSAQLSFAGRRLNLLPSATMFPAHRAMLDEIDDSADFDASYRRQMIRVHEAGVRLHRDYAQAGDSPTLRPVAELAFQAMRRHLQDLGGLR
jgi:predicted outer membrane protein